MAGPMRVNIEKENKKTKKEYFGFSKYKNQLHQSINIKT